MSIFNKCYVYAHFFVEKNSMKVYGRKKAYVQKMKGYIVRFARQKFAFGVGERLQKIA